MAHPGRGGRTQNELTLDQVISVAIEILDERGVAGLSMRALGQRLGRSTMAVYHYVENRDELLRLAANHAEAPAPEASADLPWFERLDALIRDGWETTWSVHPWLVELMQQGLLDPQSSRRLIGTRSIYVEAGFEGRDLELALIAHWSFVVGTLTVVQGVRSAGGSTVTVEGEILRSNLETFVLGVRARAAQSVASS